MTPVSYKRHRFPPDVIRHAVWLYFRFMLSLRDVEELLAQRGIEVSYETIRCWTRKFGQLYAANIRRSRSAPTGRWHLDEMVVKVGGQRMWLWRAVDDEGEVLDVLLHKRCNKDAALKLLRRLLKNQGCPESIVTDGLASYCAADARSRLDRTPLPRRHACQQPRRELASADLTTRTKAAEIQVARFSLTVSLHPRRSLQQFKHSAPPRSRPTLRHFREAAHHTWAATAAAT